VEPQIRYTKTTDGIRIAYYAIGRGPALVYMPPMPLTHVELEWKVDDLRRAQEAAASASTFVRYDGRGFGLSDRSAKSFSLEAMVSDLEAVADTATPGLFALMATEHMAIPALAYAARHPERVTALVLWLGVSRGEDLFGGRMNTLLKLARSDWEFCKETLSHTIGFDSVSANRAFEQLVNEATTQESYIAFLEAIRSWDATDLIHEVKVPVLVLARREFKLIPMETIRNLAASLPNAEFVTLEGAATAMTMPDVGAAIAAFFARLSATQARPRMAEAVASGTAVILFTDIVDSTALTESMGDARFREASRALDAGLRAAIREVGGTVMDGKLLGDGVLATFPSAAQAIDGARRCLALSTASELGLHIGLHAGDVIREDSNVFGGAVNIAARICALSEPGQILVSDVVRGMARSSAGVAFEDRGEQAMKGIGEPVRVYEVT